MSEYDNPLHSRLVRVKLLEIEGKILNTMESLILNQCDVLEERCRLLFANIDAINKRENDLSEAIGSYNHRMSECRRNQEKIQESYLKFLERASNAMEDAGLLTEEVAEKEKTFFETVNKILEGTEAYVPDEEWMASEEKLLEWYNEQAASTKKFIDEMAIKKGERDARLKAVLPSTETRCSQSNIVLDPTDLVPED